MRLLRHRFLVITPFLITTLVVSITWSEGTTLPQPIAAANSTDNSFQSESWVPDDTEIDMLSQITFQDYTLRIYRQTGYSHALPRFSFEVHKQNQIIYEEKGNDNSSYGIMSYDPKVCVGACHISDFNLPAITVGRDITGAGVPYAVIREWTGGVNCCSIYHLFEIGPQFRHVGSLVDHTGGDMENFVDVDHDGFLEFITMDGSLAYPNGYAHAEAHFPNVVFKYQHGHYQLSTALMRRPAPSAKELTVKAQDIRAAYLQSTPQLSWENRPFSSDGSVLPPWELWQEMMDLIYSGHMDLAWQFFDLAWPPEAQGKAEWRKAFAEMLAKGEHWPQIVTMNLQNNYNSPDSFAELSLQARAVPGTRWCTRPTATRRR